MQQSHGHWETIRIGGKTADVWTPSSGPPFAQAVLFLHGHSGQTLVDDPVFTGELERRQLPAVCPHGGRSWWLDRLCREFDEAVTPLAFLREQVVPWIDERWNVKPPHIGLLGVSMGGQGVLQLAYRYPREYSVVAAISPAVDFHNLYGQGLPLDEMFSGKEAARQETATLRIHPLNWPRHQLLVCDPADDLWFEGAERLASKLWSIGIPFESDLETSAGGHSWQYYQSMAARCVDFLADRLNALAP